MKRQQSCISDFVAYLAIPISTWEHQPRHDNSIPCMAIYSRFIEIKCNQGERNSNFVGGIFSDRNDVRAPIQYRGESQPQHLQRWFFLKNRPIHFHVSSTSVIRPIKQNQSSFSSIELQATSYPSQQCLVDKIQVQKPIIVVATDQIPEPDQSRE